MLLTTKNKTNIASIVAKSRTLAERLFIAASDTTNSSNSKFLQSDVGGDLDSRIKIEERLKQWCQVVAKGDYARFEKRLTWAGLSIEAIRPLLADVDVDVDVDEIDSLPDWARTLQQVIEQAQNLSLEQIFAERSYLDSINPVPFEQIYVPCLQVAKSLLSQRVGNCLDLLADSAKAALERQLLGQLNNICFATLMSEFSAFKLSKNILHNLISFSTRNNTSSSKYDAFIKQLFADGLQSLFLKYSVLGRLIATKIDLWLDATGEFIERLADNWSQIEQRISPKQSLSQIVTIKTGLSDPHNGGRTVIILTFDTGMKLVYKPKDIGIDVAFFQLLDWFNAQKALLPFKVLQAIDYGTHGWIEYVEQLPCNDRSQVKRFYQRAGILLCLVYLLEGTDCHYENVIANGEHPMLIDIETLLHHRTKNDRQLDTNAKGLAENKLNSSVLQSMILPKWGMFAKDSLAVDLSALGGTEEQKLTVPQVQEINTDEMHVGIKSYLNKQANIPKFRNEPLNARNYLSDIILGFEQMYDFFCTHRETLLAADSPLQNFARQKVRYVFRATRTYQIILNNSFNPDLLQSGIDRSISIDILSRAFIIGENKPAFWSILDAELQAIEGLDIPLFEVNTDRTSIELATGVTIPELFSESSFKAVISRLESLNKEDLTLQLEIIRGSFCAKFAREDDCIVLESENEVSLSKLTLTSEQLVQEAVAIARELQQQGIYHDDSVSWIGLGLRPNSFGFQLQSLSNNLYDGCCGVAVFFAALAKITQNQDWQDLALKTLQPLRQCLQDSNSEIFNRLKREGIGGATGLGSMVYSLVQISHLIDNPDLIEDAKKVASLITTDAIAQDGCLTLMNGTAGTILACLKLHEVEPSALEQAIACGEHLLSLQELVCQRLKTGLAQGSTGIAYALAQLFEVTQDSKYLAGVQKAIAHEQNWLDTNSQEIVFNNSWASGIAGIGLGRLGSLSVLDTPAIRQEIERIVTQTQKHCLSDVDNLAWGNFGRIETLLVASQTFNRQELYEFVLQATTTLVRQAQSKGRFNFNSSSVPAIYNPGFFHGTSGIGYQLLRIAYPHLLPSILLWE